MVVHIKHLCKIQSQDNSVHNNIRSSGQSEKSGNTIWRLYSHISWQENSIKEASTLLRKRLIKALDMDSKSHAFTVCTAQRRLWTSTV